VEWCARVYAAWLRMGAPMKPVSSRATATTTLGRGLPRSSMRLKRRWRRSMALSAMATMRAGILVDQHV